MAIKTAIIVTLSITLSACASFEGFREHFKSSSQKAQMTTVQPVVKVVVKEKTPNKPRHDCSYIIRDLSANATDIWCVPQGMDL